MPFDGTTPLEFSEAIEIIGGLSNPSKMPWWAWSIDARECRTGSKLRKIENSVCSKCYACKGFYVFKAPRNAMARRLEALKHPQFVEAFILTLNTLYRRGKKTYLVDGQQVKENRFRWHDSGDIQGVDHFRMICEIAAGTPEILHYLPTKEPGYVAQFVKKGTIPDNLFVKISNPVIGQDFKKAPSGLPYSTVDVEGPHLFQCPALRFQGNKCLDCKACWTTANINYPVH